VTRQPPSALPEPGVISIYQPRGAPPSRRVIPGYGTISNERLGSVRNALSYWARGVQARERIRARNRAILIGPVEELDEEHDEL